MHFKQALAQVSSLEERLKQKEALINALKSSNPTVSQFNEFFNVFFIRP